LVQKIGLANWEGGRNEVLILIGRGAGSAFLLLRFPLRIQSGFDLAVWNSDQTPHKIRELAKITRHILGGSRWVFRCSLHRMERIAVLCESQDVELSFLITFRARSTMSQQESIFKPLLSMAVFCEKVLREGDGVISIIRVVDRFMVRGATPQIGNQVLRFQTVIIFKSGDLRGKYIIRIKPTSPTGIELPGMEFPTFFEGDSDRGAAIVADTNFAIDEEGLFWFDIYLETELVTRMPLRVMYQQAGIATAGM
jgi:hypothetical protein